MAFLLKRSTRSSRLQLSYYGGSPLVCHRPRPQADDLLPLSDASPGDRLQLDAVAGALPADCCRRYDLQPGTTICVLSVRPSGSVIFAVGSPDGPQIGVGAAVAAEIWARHQPAPAPTDPLATHLHELGIGSIGRVVGYEWVYRGYMGKLTGMGLVPGVEFVLRCARGNSFEIELAGTRLTLNKLEATALAIEPADLD